jgi:hypothetical protein
MSDVQLQGYVLVRVHLAQFNTVAARQVLDALPAIRDSRDPRLAVARCQLDLLERRPIADDIASIVEHRGDYDLGWRYASRVRDARLMQQRPSIAVDLADVFLATFGNDPYLWAHARGIDGIRPQLLPLLSRELRFASHDPHIWRAVSIFVDDGLPIGEELDLRMRDQLASLNFTVD